MGMRALSSTAIELPVSGVWTLSVAVTDPDGAPVDVTPAVTITLPGGSTATPTAEPVTAGVYRAEYVVAAAGRYVARVTTPVNGAADFTAHVTAAVAAADMPDLADCNEYLGEHSHTDDELQDALDAEAANQRRVCRVPAAYGADLRQALLRRVARNLAMRRQKLGLILPGDDAGSASFIPRLDGEIRRFEAPYRRLPVG